MEFSRTTYPIPRLRAYFLSLSYFRNRFFLVCLVFLFTCGINFCPVFAQERSGDVFQSLDKERKELPKLKRPGAPPEIIEEKPKLPKEAAKKEKRVFVRKFIVEGCTLFPPEKLTSIVKSFQARELSFGEIMNVADLITDAYRQAGFIAAYAYIPPQELKNASVIIKVVEAKVGSISVSGNEYYKTSFIEKHVAKVKDDPSPREETLERALLILNDYPSLNVKALLKEGKTPFTTDVALKVTDSFPISGRIFYDNFGADTTSKNRVGIGLDAGNLLMAGDLVSLTGITGIDRIDFDKLSYGRAEYAVPLGYNGTRLSAYYTNSVYTAGGVVEPLNINGYANVAGIAVSHPFIKRTDYTLAGRIGFDYKDVYEYMLENIRSKDRIRVLTVGLSYDGVDRFVGRNILGITYSQGLRYILNGAGAESENPSRQNADGSFSKINVDAMRVQGITEFTRLSLKATGQYSPDDLFVAEQFIMGGQGTVRGYDLAAASGDYGYVLSAELSFSPLFPEKTIFSQKVGELIRFTLFCDHGGVRFNDPAPGQDGWTYMTSLGGGIHFNFNRRFIARLEYAVPRTDGSFDTSYGKAYIQTVYSF